MIRKQALGGLSVLGLLVFCTAIAGTGQLGKKARAETFTVVADRDNTLFQYDGSTYDKFNSNGLGDQFGSGRTRKKSQIQRGLLHFPVDAMPADAIITSVNVRLRLISFPKQDSAPRPFWLVALDASHFATGDDWGEGTSQMDYNPAGGSGGGAAATDGDATWWHSKYDSGTHGSSGSLVPFPGTETDGFWRQEGALGSSAYAPGYDHAAMVDSDLYLDLERNFYFLSSDNSPQVKTDVQAWVDGSAENFGWIVLGDELINGSSVSSKREFASRESTSFDPIGTESWSYRPTLFVEYTTGAAVPEPAACLLALIGLILASGCVRRRKK